MNKLHFLIVAIFIWLKHLDLEALYKSQQNINLLPFASAKCEQCIAELELGLVLCFQSSAHGISFM